MSAALRDLDARIRVEGIAGGIDDFATWDRSAVDIEVLGVPTRLAALGDIIASKQAADRDKDRLALPMLRELARRLGRDRPG